MMIIDHLIRFASAQAVVDDLTGEESALAGLVWQRPDRGADPLVRLADGEPLWASCCHICRIVIQDAVHDIETGEQIAPEVVAPGHYVWASMTYLHEGIRGLPGNACRIIAQQDGGGAWLLYAASDMDPEVMEQARIDPVIAGSCYPFRAG